MEKKYDYTIHPDNSPERFKRVCQIIEQAYPEMKKAELLVDVDGSTIQIFGEEPNEIIVYDDYGVGALYIKSDIDLTTIIEKARKAAA